MKNTGKQEHSETADLRQGSSFPLSIADLWPGPFKIESFPDVNVAINPWKFHHTTTNIVVSLGELFKVKVKGQGQGHIWCRFS